MGEVFSRAEYKKCFGFATGEGVQLDTRYFKTSDSSLFKTSSNQNIVVK